MTTTRATPTSSNVIAAARQTVGPMGTPGEPNRGGTVATTLVETVVPKPRSKRLLTQRQY
jgi:hypothetical protein